MNWTDIKIQSSARPDLTPNSLEVLKRRYLAKDEKGATCETPEEMFSRIARFVATGDFQHTKNEEEVTHTANEFYNMICALEFMPNSPTIMNAGRPLGQLSACFVLPVEDSIDKIFDTIKYMALIHKSGGGTGFSFSRLRPNNDMVMSTAGVSSGPVSFMNIFNAATETIKQGGTRRGANMAILSISHPDILEFISAKEDTTHLTNFNCSVALTADFMRAVNTDSEYDLINPRNNQPVKKLKAREVFARIVRQAWQTGEPGIVFIDRINEKNPLREIGLIESTNPCGEQPLLPYESCNLGSINLIKMLKLENENYVIDYDKLERTVRSSVHFLDNVIDLNRYPLPEIEKNTKANRKIGLGVMAFSDVLIKMGIAYNSPEAIKAAEDIMSFIQRTADSASADLAEKRGVFPNWEKSDYAKENRRLRNATRTTIAPTGTISIIAGVSSGIEPIFALAYTRNVMDGTKLTEVNPLFDETARKRNFHSAELLEDVAAQGTVAHIDTVPADVRRVFVTAHDISPEWHIRVQAAFQKYIDNAVSKTVNFPSDATEADIEKVYRMAYDLGCKGVTVYRDGSRSGQVLEVNRAVESASAADDDCGDVFRHLTPKKRGELTWGTTRKMMTGCGSLYVTINEDEGGLFEVFAAMGKSGGCAASQTEAVSRLISLSLRCGVEPEEIIKQIKGVRCPNQAWEKGGRVYSCADAIAKAMERYLGMKSKWVDVEDTQIEHTAQAETNGKGSDAVMVGVCPECHGPLEFESGCSVCRSCGFSRCG